MSNLLKALKKRIQNVDKNYLYILILCLFMLLPYVSKSYNQGDDTAYHLASIYGMSLTNTFNIFKEKIFRFFDNDLGYGIGLFYPQLSHIIPFFILKILGVFRIGVISSIKISKFLVLYISGIGMYKLVNLITLNRRSALTSSFLYVTMPYFLLDIYVRDAMAETYVFVFVPILFISIYYMLNNNLRSFLIYFVLGLVGLINSHLILTMYLACYMFIVCFINYKQIFQVKNIVAIIIGVIISLIVCLPFLVPLIEHKILGNYLVFQPNYMTWWGTLNKHRIDLYQLFWDNSNSKYIFINNIFAWLIFFITLFRYKKIRTKNNSFYIKSALTFIIISIVLSSKIIDWASMPETLRMLQFPWRLMAFLGFGLCLLAGVVLEKLDFILVSKDVLLFAVFVSCFIYGIIPSKKITLEEDYLNKVKGPYVHANVVFQEYGSFAEYLPVEVSKDYEYSLNRKNEIVVVSGQGLINNLENTISYMSFNTSRVSKAKLEIPCFFYLGYTIYADYGNGNIECIPYYSNSRGYIEFELDKDAQIRIEYTGTKLDNICSIASPIAILCFVIYVIVSSKKSQIIV